MGFQKECQQRFSALVLLDVIYQCNDHLLLTTDITKGAAEVFDGFLERGKYPSSDFFEGWIRRATPASPSAGNSEYIARFDSHLPPQLPTPIEISPLLFRESFR
jgi:hypothetical protein